MKHDYQSIQNLDFSRFTDEQIMEHFNRRCVICGGTWGVACHHIIFKSQGGLNQPRLPLCGECHTGKKSIHNDADFRKKHEPKLCKIAETFYQLMTQTSIF